MMTGAVCLVGAIWYLYGLLIAAIVGIVLFFAYQAQFNDR